MVVSITLDAIIETGPTQGYPEKPAKLGCFENGANEVAAGNVFVLVVHYDFKDGQDDWPRPGNEKDVENLRKTFAENRNCAFRECSPKREDLLALLQDEQKLRRFIGTSEEPDVFFLIVLSHGAADGVIFTDFLRSSDPNDYENFTTNELFKSIEIVFPKCLKSVFLGPCRGQLEDRVYWPDQASKPDPKNDLTKNQNSSRVSFEPKMRNLLILYSTVETTKARRGETGTWLVKFLCAELNEMKQATNLTKFLTGIQNRIHFESTTFRSDGQTPEFKMFPCDRKFIFQPPESKKTEAGPSKSGTDAKMAVSGHVEEKPRSIDFDWWNPKTKKVLRGRRAVIFHYGEENELIRNLDTALTYNLGFEIINTKIDKNGLNYYFSQSEKSWTDYGCFAAFFFAEIAEQEDGQVCIRLNEDEKVPIGKLIHGLLGPKNGDWIGKPKLFFLVDTKFVASDSAGEAKKFNPHDFFRATNHCGWLVFTLINATLLQNFIKIFEKQEIKRTRSLQESLADLLMNDESEAMMVSTLPHQLFFPTLERNFVQPEFRVDGKGFEPRKVISWDKFLESKQIKEEHGIWLLSSDPGSGKSTVMRELASELQRNLKDEIKVLLIVLYDTYSLFAKAKKERRKCPSLASVVSHATGTRELEIQILIEQKKIMLMFDGFDEICPFYRDQVLQVFAAVVEAKMPFWISTRPHEEDAILAKLGKEVSKVVIWPLDWRKKIDFLVMISKKSEEECQRQIEYYTSNGLVDILGNPLHLKMIAELSDADYKKSTNLYEIYEKIVDKKLRFALRHLSGLQFEHELFCCETELRIAAVKFLCGGKVDCVKNANNGIVTFSDRYARFVHQTFAEFLAAAHFVNCLFCEDEEMPFDILNKEFRQVRKFVQLKLSSSCVDEANLISLKKFLKKHLTKARLENVILKECLANFSSAAANLVTFNPDDTTELNYATTDHILVLASKWNEILALGLLKNGAYENLADPNNAAVEMLVSAIEYNFALLFSYLVEKCANYTVLVRNNFKIKMAVESALERNHHEVFRLVIEKGIIDANDQDALENVLKSAARGIKSAECIELLIERGARTAKIGEFDLLRLSVKKTEALLKTKDEPVLKLASRIFKCALSTTRAKVAIFLLEKFGDNAEFQVSSDALIDVTSWSHVTINHDTAATLCRLLVEKRGFRIREKDRKGRNAFHLAATNGNVGLVKYLHEKDPEIIKILTNKGENAMHLTLKNQYTHSKRKIEMLKFLNNLDAEMVRQKTASNETMLHLAASTKNLDVCKWLVEEAGFGEVDAVDDRGWNAMHFAASITDPFTVIKPELLDYLLGLSGELAKQKTETNKTLLHLAAKIGNLDLCKWLLEKARVAIDAVDDDGWNVMHFAASCMWVGRAFQLLQYLHGSSGDLVSKSTNKNKTVLHIAAENEKLKECKWLVDEAGVDVDAVDDNGWNVLHFAAFHRLELEFLQYLHAKNPQLIEKKTNRNETLLHLVTKNWLGKVEIYHWLVGKGLDESVQNSDGKTALQAAHANFLQKYNEISKK